MDTLKLRKRILGIVVLMVFRYETFAQSYYMHEVAEDRGYNNFGLDFLEVLQWVIIIGIGLLFLVGFGIGWIKELFEDSSSNTHTPQPPPPMRLYRKGSFIMVGLNLILILGNMDI